MRFFLCDFLKCAVDYNICLRIGRHNVNKAVDNYFLKITDRIFKREERIGLDRKPEKRYKSNLNVILLKHKKGGSHWGHKKCFKKPHKNAVF